MFPRRTRISKLFSILLVTLLQLPFWSFTAAAIESTPDSANEPELYSETAVLMDADTGQILYQKEKDKKMYPASITKIMTAMLALKYGNLSDPISMSYDAVFSIDRQSSHIALDVGEQITLEQALYALGIESANDAANGIAEHVGGTMADFVKMMNAQVDMLGLKNTQFANAHGLPDENHFTTAYDMAIITSEAIKIPELIKFFSTMRYEVPPTNEQPETRYFNNGNKFLNGVTLYDGILMSKTGWTSEAQHTLVTVAQRNGTTLIAVVMKSSQANQKWQDTISLLDYGFNQYYPISVDNSFLQDKLRTSNTDMGRTQNSNVPFSATISKILIPIEKSLEDVTITLESNSNSLPNTLSACIQISSEGGNEPVELIDAFVNIAVPDSAIAPATPNSVDTRSNSTIQKMFFLLVGLGAICLIVILRMLQIAHRKKMRRRRRQRKQRNRDHNHQRH